MLCFEPVDLAQFMPKLTRLFSWRVRLIRPWSIYLDAPKFHSRHSPPSSRSRSVNVCGTTENCFRRKYTGLPFTVVAHTVVLRVLFNA